MLIPLFSHSYTPTCSSPQGAILRESWYTCWPCSRSVSVNKIRVYPVHEKLSALLDDGPFRAKKRL